MRVGVYVDTDNITRNGGRGLRYDVLREFACRDGADALRLNSYTSFDRERAQTDEDYRRNVQSFQAALRDFGYKVIVKHVKWYINEDGKRFGKANSDLDMAVDVLLEARNIDRVLLATGDGDFAKVARALQNMGCRVEVVAFDNVSGDLRREADLFVSGYLIPGLLPGESRGPDWGGRGFAGPRPVPLVRRREGIRLHSLPALVHGAAMGYRYDSPGLALRVDVRAQQRAATGRHQYPGAAEPASHPGVHLGAVTHETRRADRPGNNARPVTVPGTATAGPGRTRLRQHGNVRSQLRNH